MALAMQGRAAELARDWLRRGYDLALGVGIAHGYATMGQIGFEGRWDYGAVGSVVNLAARLCGEAQAARSSSAPALTLSWRIWSIADQSARST